MHSVADQRQFNVLRLAKVTATIPHAHAVDVIFLDDGSRAPGVVVATPYATTNTGRVDLPSPTPPANGEDGSSLTHDRDLLAVIAMVQHVPVVIAFLHAQFSEMLFDRPDFLVERHASDVYRTTEQNGDTEFYHPSDTWLRIGVQEDHVDLTGQDFDGKWAIRKNTGRSVHVKLSVNGGKTVFHVEPNGDVRFETRGEVKVDADGDIQVESAGDIQVKSAGAVKIEGSTIDLN